MKKTMLLVVLLTGFSNLAFSHCMTHKYYAGGGLALNSVGIYDDATGYQIFGGYCLDFNFNNPKAKTSVELGYMNSGEFERTYDRFSNNPNRGPDFVRETQEYGGAWLAGLAEYKMDNRIHFMGRLGADFGDDSGLLVGGGFGFNLTKFAQFRGEYVVRDNIDSLQFNLITEF